MRVSELFVSPQGEGARAGELSAFVRLSGCSAKHACYELGVRCDTEFESGREMSDEEVADAIASACPAVRWIVWTGGEPLDQLTKERVAWFRRRGWRQALETSGVRPFARDFRTMFDWIACSPKVAEHVLAKHFGEPGVLEMRHAAPEPHDAAGQPNVNHEPVAVHVHELRYVRHVGQDLPVPSLRALTYYLSPHSDGKAINGDNLRHVLALQKRDPRWRISVQQHKQWSVL